MRKATIGFLVRDGAVLLGEKKRGAEIGSGTLNGPGGKLKPGETAESCMIRECREEIDVRVTAYQKRAELTFYATGIPFMEVHVYLISAWEDDPRESNEMFLPIWYPFHSLPFRQMLEADVEWIPLVLAGEKFTARVYYREPAAGFERIEFLPFEG